MANKQSERWVLLCTVGTSLKGTLEQWYVREEGEQQGIADFTEEDWSKAANYIGELDPSRRDCGAEINSIHNLIEARNMVSTPDIHLFHSDTDDGRNIACLLQRAYVHRGIREDKVQLHVIEGLRDSDPKAFRTRGLRNLVRQLCYFIRKFSPEACAINATGGYKAQIAIAVMIGQALRVPVYYKHEFFREHSIISFPPLPITLDESVWRSNMTLFEELHEADDFVPASQYDEELDEVLESLVERERQEGEEFLMLSSAGQILHEMFKDRLWEEVEPLAEAKSKQPLIFSKDHGSEKQHLIRPFLEKVRDSNPFVVTCRSWYFNPDLPQSNHFRMSRGQVTGVYSDGSFTAKFEVKTTAKAENQKSLAVNRLNQWLKES